MARGTVVGEAVVSQAGSEEFRSGYERIYGDRKPQRGRWVYDPAQGRCVPADQYQPPARALDAPILSGRFYENQATQDGRDIGSRDRFRKYLAETGATHASDYGPDYSARVRRQQELAEKRDRREKVGRAAYAVLERGYKPHRPDGDL